VNRYLLDTDTCIYLVNRKPGFESILRRIEGKAYGEVVISSITFAELMYGVAKSRFQKQNQRAAHVFFAHFPILPFDEAAAEAYGPLRAKLESQGKPIGPLDTLIAAHALSIEAAVVTNNVREFSRVVGLSVENWSKSR
jgi:tRNA(fMet)-specific endonuclease VapC